MKASALTIEQTPTAESFDLCRISKSKQICDVAPNTIRAYAKKGLRVYYAGKSCFFSKSELINFIKQGAVQS